MTLSGTVGGLIGLWRGQHGFGWSNLSSGWPLRLTIIAVLSFGLFIWRFVEGEREKQVEKKERDEDRQILRGLDQWRQTQSASGVAETATGYVNTGLGMANVTARASVELGGMEVPKESEGDAGA